MNQKDIAGKIDELKIEYVQIQQDIEKLESVGHSIDIQENMLQEIETELAKYHSMEN